MEIMFPQQADINHHLCPMWVYSNFELSKLAKIQVCPGVHSVQI